jgi:hypothetical protein
MKTDNIIKNDFILDPVDWQAINKYVAKDPNERFWLSVLSTAVRDWAKFKEHPCRNTWRNARTVTDWPHSWTFEIVSGLINNLTGMPEETFKKKFIEWMGPLPKWGINVDDLIESVEEPDVEVYVCNICDEKVDVLELRNHLGEHNPNGYNVDYPINFYTIIIGENNE